MYYYKNWALVIPMANEEKEFSLFIDMLKFVINTLNPGKIYFIIDSVSKDRTLELCQGLSLKDPRFVTIWAPENRNVVDAYLKGYSVAYEAGHEIIIEMDAGMSHDPRAIPMFLRVLNEGNECAFGSRFISGGSMADSPFLRRFLSKGGTIVANFLLGTKLHDMTSGFQGFHRSIIKRIINHNFLSTGHFFQVELRYILRNCRTYEVPIHYRAPSPRVSSSSIRNAFTTLLYYFFVRLKLTKKLHID